MNVLEKILEEIEEKIKNTNNCSENLAFIDGIQYGLIEAKKIIRSHMADVPDTGYPTGRNLNEVREEWDRRNSLN